MSCDCGQCRQHYRTLGIAYGVPTEAEIQEAYREAIKQWHPDLFQNFEFLRADAEEHFKQIQIAFRELKEHNAVAAESPAESVAVQLKEKSAGSAVVQPPSVSIQPKEEARSISFDAAPSISFGDASGCLLAPHFTPEAEELIARHRGRLGTALALIDLSGARSHPGSYAQFLLITELGILVRDARSIISLLWYRDVGEVSLIDKRRGGKLSFSQKLTEKITGIRYNYSLQICRNNGTRFFSMTDQVDDSVKKVIYNFLLQQKTRVNL